MSYNAVKYDDIHDDYKKTAKYDMVRNIEAEAYVKIEKDYQLDEGQAAIYAKPAIVQSFGKGDVEITGLSKTDGLDDMTYGRIEVGANVDLDNGWSVYGNVSQSFGDYEATSVNVGVSYSW